MQKPFQENQNPGNPILIYEISGNRKNNSKMINNNSLLPCPEQQ